MPAKETFDPYNYNHLLAYEYLSKHGTWPEGVEFEECKENSVWLVSILHKMASAWLVHNKACFSQKERKQNE